MWRYFPKISYFALQVTNDTAVFIWLPTYFASICLRWIWMSEFYVTIQQALLLPIFDYFAYSRPYKRLKIASLENIIQRGFSPVGAIVSECKRSSREKGCASFKTLKKAMHFVSLGTKGTEGGLKRRPSYFVINSFYCRKIFCFWTPLDKYADKSMSFTK